MCRHKDALEAELVAEIIKQKKIEEKAKRLRNDAEAMLVESSGFNLEEGSKTLEVGGHKVVFRQPITRSIDDAAWHSVSGAISAITGGSLSPVVTKLAINAKDFRKLREVFPEAFKIASGAISSKPGKVGVTVKAEVA